MHKHTSKLVRLIVLLIVTVMLSSQIFGIVVYARGSSKSSSHSTSSKSSSSKSTSSSSKSKSSSTKSTPTSGAKSGSFSSSPKSSSSVGSSTTKSNASPKSSATVNNKNNTVVVNNHTYPSYYSNSYLPFHRAYYLDDYGTRRYMPYSLNIGGTITTIIILIIIIFVVVRIKSNNRY